LKTAVPANRYFAFFAIAIVGCAIDLATKHWMFAHLGMPGPESSTWWIWDGVFGFQTSLNEGALFGLGQGFSWLFAVLATGAAVGIVVWLFGTGAARDWLLTIALAIVTVGILGNLYDRVGLPGLRWNEFYPPHQPGEPVYAVRDFILVMIGSYHWPNFNIADPCLVGGAALLVWHAFFTKPEPDANESTRPLGEG
jgi:signal peptidase II